MHHDQQLGEDTATTLHHEALHITMSIERRRSNDIASRSAMHHDQQLRVDTTTLHHEARHITMS